MQTRDHGTFEYVSDLCRAWLRETTPARKSAFFVILAAMLGSTGYVGNYVLTPNTARDRIVTAIVVLLIGHVISLLVLGFPLWKRDQKRIDDLVEKSKTDPSHEDLVIEELRTLNCPLVPGMDGPAFVLACGAKLQSPNSAGHIDLATIAMGSPYVQDKSSQTYSAYGQFLTDLRRLKIIRIAAHHYGGFEFDEPGERIYLRLRHRAQSLR